MGGRGSYGPIGNGGDDGIPTGETFWDALLSFVYPDYHYYGGEYRISYGACSDLSNLAITQMDGYRLIHKISEPPAGGSIPIPNSYLRNYSG